MNDRDLELIIGLIDQTLPPDDAAAARARLETDPAFATAYAEQVSVSDTLSSLGPVAMTADESSDLRQRLTQQLALDEPVATPRAASTGLFARWWKPMTGLAAAAAVVAVIVVPGTLGSGGDEAAFSEITTDEATGDDGAEAGSAPSEVPFTPQDLERIVEVSPTNDRISVPDLSGTSSAELMSATAEDDSQEMAAESIEDIGYSSRVSLDPVAIEACLELLAPTLPEDTTDVFVLGAYDGTGSDGQVVVLGIAGQNGVQSTLAVDLDSCAVVDLDR